jgi:hypothetical protein
VSDWQLNQLCVCEDLLACVCKRSSLLRSPSGHWSGSECVVVPVFNRFGVDERVSVSECVFVCVCCECVSTYSARGYKLIVRGTSSRPLD